MSAFAGAGRLESLLLLFRFGAVGILNTAFGYVVFAAFVLAGTPHTPALALSTIAGVAFNFQTSRRLVFHTAGRVLRFVGVYCVAFALNLAALSRLAELGVPALLAQAMLALPIAVVSFLAQKNFVFGAAGRSA